MLIAIEVCEPACVYKVTFVNCLHNLRTETIPFATTVSF